MSYKQKLLEALNITFDDLSESRLLDILLDAYKAKKERIIQLEAENAHERETLRAEREALLSERRRMQTDPTYFISGDFLFRCRDRSFCVTIVSGRVEMFERSQGCDFRAQPMSHENWP